MNQKLVLAVSLLLFGVTPCLISAQGKAGFVIDGKIDFVSQNVWRGCYQAGTSLQPEAAVSFDKWEFSVWGTTDLQVVEKEIDLTVKYAPGNFTLGITDYWFGGETAPYGKGHISEIGTGYGFSSIPVSLSFNTAVYGDGGHFSSYAEIAWTPRWKEWQLEFSTGLCPWENSMLATERFAVTCLSAELRKRAVTYDTFTVEASTKAVYNPNEDTAFWMSGISVLF
jgi:hypothetical protein